MLACTHSRAEISPGMVLWNAALVWQRAMTAALRPLGLTPAQFVVLDAIAGYEDEGIEPNQIMIGARAGTGLAMTSQIITRLASAQLVIRLTDPSDGRANRVTITPTGRALSARAARSANAVDTALFGELGQTVLQLKALDGRFYPGAARGGIEPLD